MEQDKYELFTIVNKKHKQISIKLHDLHKIRQSYESLYLITGIEEKWDMLIENFFDYEYARIEITLRDALTSRFSTADFFCINRTIGRKLLNLLSSARLYIDYQHSKLNKVDREISSHLKKLKNDIYDAEPDYRLMYAIRNVLQHQEIPIGVSRRMKRVEDGNNIKIQYSTGPLLILEYIMYDKTLNKIIKDDLKNEKNTKKPITAVVQHYMELMWRIHSEFRNSTSDIRKESEQILEHYLKHLYDPDSIQSDQGQRTAIVLKNGVNNTSDKDNINEFADTLVINLHYMVEKNTSLENIENRIVSNE